MKSCTFGSYTESHQGGVPLTIYDASDPSLPMLVFSPLDTPMAQHMASTSSWVGAGIKSTVTTIPGGWSQLFILSAGTGINGGMMAWGDRMLKYTGKPRADMYRDTTHSTIGFWTDNGGYYHYSTGVDKTKTYEEVLPLVKQYHDEIGVPFGHWQFDSWFYPKDGSVNAGGGGGSVINWTAMTGHDNGVSTVVFPSGMAGIQKKLASNTSNSLTPGLMPTVMHNRQWSDNSDYVKNWPEIQWYGPKDSKEPSKFAMAVDPPAFFTKFFKQQEGWGLTMYEQDWMCTEYDGVDVLQTNISMGDLWLEGMAVGAASSNRTIQYCMPYPNEVLSASKYAAVTNARATGDYFHANNQWEVGTTSLFYWAIGILPFKDGFYSSNNKQVGGQTVGPEKSPDRETIMATLSGAMVGPMDGINLLNKTRIMTTCRADGQVLKPDKPVSISDYCFKNGDPSKCSVYHTFSDVVGIPRTHYVFCNGGCNADGTFEAAMASLDGSVDYMLYNWYNPAAGAVPLKGAAVPISNGYEGNAYAVVAPVVNGWAFFGETNKYVTASTVRFASVKANGASGLTAAVIGVAGEVVTVCAADGAKVQCQQVKFTTAGTQSVSFASTQDVLSATI